MFALFMSINNLGSTLGSFLGSALASALNLTTGHFDNLALGLGVQMICTLLPIGFLSLIPKEVTGLTLVEGNVLRFFLLNETHAVACYRKGGNVLRLNLKFLTQATYTYSSVPK